MPHTVTKKLATWPAERGYVDEHRAVDAIDAVEIPADAGRLLPQAERLGDVLYGVMQAPPPLRAGLAYGEYFEDMAVTSRIEPGAL